jgi:hypothetical protein
MCIKLIQVSVTNMFCKREIKVCRATMTAQRWVQGVLLGVSDPPRGRLLGRCRVLVLRCVSGS